MPKFPRDDVDVEDGDIDGEKRCVHCGELSPKLLFLDKMLKPTETDLFCRLEGSIESLMKSAEYRSPAGKIKLAEHQFRKIEQWLANLKSRYSRVLDQNDIDQLHNQVRKLIKFQAAAHEKATGEVASQAAPAPARDKALPPLQRRPYRNRIGKQRAKSKINSQHCKNCNGYVTPIEMRGKNEGKLPIKKCIECRTSRYIWQKVRQQRGNQDMSSGRLLELVTEQALDSLDAWEKGLRNKSTYVPESIMEWLKNGVQEEVHNRIERETGNGNFVESPRSPRHPADAMDTTMTEASQVDEYAASFGNQSEHDAASPEHGAASPGATIDEDDGSSHLSTPPLNTEHGDNDVDMDYQPRDHTPEPAPTAKGKGKIKLRVSPKATPAAAQTKSAKSAKSASPVQGVAIKSRGLTTAVNLPDHSPASWAASMVNLTRVLRDAQTELNTAQFSNLVNGIRTIDYSDPDKVISIIEAAITDR